MNWPMHGEVYPPIELSSDIEWLMFNSQRGEPERVLALISLLVDHVGKAAYLTALEMSINPEPGVLGSEELALARKIAAEGLLRMVAQGQRYHQGIDLVIWACRADEYIHFPVDTLEGFEGCGRIPSP